MGDSFTKSFRVNEYITLKLEFGKTFIYLKDKKFLQCIRLALNLKKDDHQIYDAIDSIDEAAEVYKLTLWRNKIVEGPKAIPSVIENETIAPEEEFWGHCSNIQTWVELNYNTRILHSNLSFYLLLALAKLGDKKASNVFREEVAQRFESGYLPTQISLINQQHLFYLNKEQLESIINLKKINYLLEKFPNDMVLKSELGLICGKLKLDNKALRLIKEVEDFNPKDYSIWESVGRYYYGILHDNEKAIRAWKRGLDLKPDSYFLLNRLGYIYRILKKFKKAKISLEKSLELNSTFSWTLTNLAILYMEQGENKKAKIYYEKAIENDPFQESAYSNLGELYYLEKKYKKAELLFRKELKNHPDHYGALYYMGCLYNRRKEYFHAIKVLEYALGYDDSQKQFFSINDLSIYKQLCVAYYRVRNYKKAQKMVLEVIKLNSDDKCINYLENKLSNTK